MRDLGNFLYTKGFTVFCPRFSRFDLKERPTSWESWVTLADSTYATVRDYSKQSIIIGMGLGGTIGIILARLYESPALVLLAPAIAPRLQLRERLVGLTRFVSPALFSRWAGWNGEVLKAMDHVRKSGQEIKCPALVLQARDDGVVSSKGLKLIRKWTTHAESEVALLAQGSHAITRGKSKDEVFDRIYRFTERLGLARASE
jgi:esterase/lipase